MGTKSENNGQSGTDVNESADFDAMATAMNEGNMAELDRLMAVEEPNAPETPEPTVEEETPEEDTPEEADTSPNTEDNPSEPATPEAADAASPALPTEDIALKNELHRLRSEAGRVPHIQRRMAELERELRAAKLARADDTSASSADSTKTPQDVSKIQLDPETQREIDDLREVDPVMARVLERVAKTAISTANARVEHAVNTLVQTDQEAEDQRFFLEQKSLLTEMIPQHEQIFASPQWREWKERLTPGRRALAESGYAEEVAQAIYAFGADMQRLNAQPAPTQAPTAVVNTPENVEVNKTRARKVEAAADVRNPTSRATVPFNEDDYFREMYEKIGKENHISTGS